MPKTYDLYLRGTTGDIDFDENYVEYVLSGAADRPVSVLISSLGGSLASALRIAAAFGRHGDVTVHYSGLNASAATIAGMGARHTSMDASACWLVHQCGYLFDVFKQCNASDMEALIADLEKAKDNLETFDKAVAGLYARRCSKTPAELAELMTRERWLTAEEAAEWGFIDEITPDGVGDKPLEIPKSVVCAIEEAGLPPVPGSKAPTFGSRVQMAVVRALRSVGIIADSSDTPDSPEPTDTPEPSDKTENNENMNPTQNPATPAPVASAEEQLAQANAELAAARARIAELEKTPGAATSNVIDNASDNQPATPNSEIGRWGRDMADAKAMFDMLP